MKTKEVSSCRTKKAYKNQDAFGKGETFVATP